MEPTQSCIFPDPRQVWRPRLTTPQRKLWSHWSGPAYCGWVAQSAYTENFTVAGGEPGNPNDPVDTTHAFYTLHADFMNGWQQTKLSGLETACIRNSGCTGHPRQRLRGRPSGMSPGEGNACR